MGFYKLSTEISKLKSKIFNDLSPVITEAEVKEALRGFTKRHRTYHTWPVFQLFLHQAATSGSCSEAISWGIANELLPINTSPLTSSYSTARNRLPEASLKELAFSVGKAIEQNARARDLVHGHHVKVVDGSSVQLQDTGTNQAEYPQSSEQKEGCGFPVMYICALMGLASGALLDASVGGGQGNERSLFRKLWSSLDEGDILLGDRGFISYADFAMLLKLGVDVVMRQRSNSFTNKKKINLGHNDWLVFWERPAAIGKWVDRDELPEMLVVRAVEYTITNENGEKEKAVIFTTLLDRKLYPVKKLVELYRRRWDMELTFRHIKTSMNMELLKCKTPKRCRCELWMGLLAYNIIRGVMLDAARKGKLPPAKISFTGTMHGLKNFASTKVFNDDPRSAYRLLLDHLLQNQVGKRPGRSEPRRIKRRKKQYSLLTEPRKPAARAVLKA